MLPFFERPGSYIDGTYSRTSGSGLLEIVCPSTEEVVGRVPSASVEDIDAAVHSARRAYDEGPWPRMTPEERRVVVRKAANLIEEQADELDRLATAENGSIIRTHPGRVAGRIRYFAEIDIPWSEPRIGLSGERALIAREPVGVVAAIVPWNAPIALAVTKVVPALLTGCSVVLKPAPETPMTAFVLAEAFHRAGLPDGVLNVVPADRAVSEDLVTHPLVDHVSFTGSTVTGKHIARLCADHVKRIGLELGGKSPAIVLDDCDLDRAAPQILGGGLLLNNGETCCAWTRILVSSTRHDELVDRFRQIASGVRIGDPFDEATELGPLVSSAHRERVEGYIALAQHEGAKIAIGGGRPASLSKGWYVEPTILVGATNEMRSSREEIFGPVVSVIPYEDEADAVRIANDTRYGLSSAIFTSDEDHGMELAGRIRAGTVGINSLAFNIAFPFGGYKESGIGRQHGPEGFHEYLEIKTIGLPPVEATTEEVRP